MNIHKTVGFIARVETIACEKAIIERISPPRCLYLSKISRMYEICTGQLSSMLAECITVAIKLPLLCKNLEVREKLARILDLDMYLSIKSLVARES